MAGERAADATTWVVRSARRGDFESLFALVSAVAAEGKWIGAQAPLDRATTIERWEAELQREDAERFVVVNDGEVVAEASVALSGGRADLGMMVSRHWRGRGVGSALLRAVVTWARNRGAHKVSLQVWPHNRTARDLYLRFGFVEEGRLVRQYRRDTGELWDAIVMGLVLDETSPGSRYAGEE